MRHMILVGLLILALVLLGTTILAQTTGAGPAVESEHADAKWPATGPRWPHRRGIRSVGGIAHHSGVGVRGAPWPA